MSSKNVVQMNHQGSLHCISLCVTLLNLGVNVNKNIVIALFIDVKKVLVKDLIETFIEMFYTKESFAIYSCSNRAVIV